MSILSMVMDFETFKVGPIKITPELVEKIINGALRLFLIIFLMIIAIKIGNGIIKKFVENQTKDKGLKFAMSPQKAKTIGEVLKSVLKYSVYVVGIAAMLQPLLGEISLAFAGIGGFAIGFGAQSLVQDFINGFFILFEDQYGVGDYVTIGQFDGIIESIGIRTTILKAFNGDLHLIPNGTVKEVTNHSRNNMRFMVDVDIAYEEDIDNAIKVIDETCKEFEKEHEEVTQPIEIWGVNDLGKSGVTIRVVGFSIPMYQWSMERKLRKEIKQAMDRANIEIPYSKTELILNKKEELEEVF